MKTRQPIILTIIQRKRSEHGQSAPAAGAPVPIVGNLSPMDVQSGANSAGHPAASPTTGNSQKWRDVTENVGANPHRRAA